MKEELKARLRKVFLEESQSDSSRIRELLPQVREALPSPPVPLMEDLYKSVHKLKGACRAVGLKPAEILGFQVEYLFRQLAEHPVEISSDVFACVEQALEEMWRQIEGYAQSVEIPFPQEVSLRMNEYLQQLGSDQQAELPSVAETDSLEPVPADASPKPPPQKEVDPRLLAAFTAESRELFHALRDALTQLKSVEAPEGVHEPVDAALHAAHTLKGSARVVEMPELSSQAHELESLLKNVLSTERAPHPREVEELESLVLKMEQPLFAESAPQPSDDAAPSSRASENGHMYRVEAQRLEELFNRFSDVLALQTSLAACRTEI